MKLLKVSVLLLAFCLGSINLAPLEETLDSSLEATDVQVELIEEVMPVDAEAAEIKGEVIGKKDKKDKKDKKGKKDKDKKDKKNPLEVMNQIQRFILNGGSSNTSEVNSTNPIWTVEEFKKHGFDMAAFLDKLNNRTLMHQVAEKFIQKGLNQYVIANFSASPNETLNINITAIFKDADVIRAFVILAKAKVFPPRSGKHVHQGKGGKGGKDCDKDKNGGKKDRKNGGKNGGKNGDEESSSEEKGGRKNKDKKNKGKSLNEWKKRKNDDDNNVPYFQLLMVSGEADAFGIQRDDNNNNNDNRKKWKKFEHRGGKDKRHGGDDENVSNSSEFIESSEN